MINLRGCCTPNPWYLDECRVTQRLDVSQEDICFSAGRLPSVPEVRRLRARHPGLDLSGLGHGYREMGAVLDRGMTLDQARASTIRQVRQYARRQLTWFRRDPRINWIAAEPQARALVERFQRSGADGGGEGLEGSG